MRAGRASLHEGCLVGWCSHCKCLFSPKLVPPRPSWPHRKLQGAALASLRRGGGALRAGQDAAAGRAEGVPRSKCVLLEILHPHVQEQAAESLRLARYGPAKMGGPRGAGVRAQTRSGTKNSHSAPAKSHAFVCPISCIAAPKIGRGLPLRGPNGKCYNAVLPKMLLFTTAPGALAVKNFYHPRSLDPTGRALP